MAKNMNSTNMLDRETSSSMRNKAINLLSLSTLKAAQADVETNIPNTALKAAIATVNSGMINYTNQHVK